MVTLQWGVPTQGVKAAHSEHGPASAQLSLRVLRHYTAYTSLPVSGKSQEDDVLTSNEQWMKLENACVEAEKQHRDGRAEYATHERTATNIKDSRYHLAWLLNATLSCLVFTVNAFGSLLSFHS